MKQHQTNRFQYSGGSTHPSAAGNRMPKGHIYATIYDVTLAWLLRKIWAGIQKMLVSLKFRWYSTAHSSGNLKRFTWWKLALVGLVIFILTKKDIQFSINMRAPLSSGKITPAKEAKAVRTNVEEMSLANTMGLKNNAPAVASIDELNEQAVRAYIKRFSKVAQAEMSKFGIPASIKMAQGILESEANQQESAKDRNNHFGAPLSEQYFASAWESWRAHSLLLKDQYATLFDAGNSYKKWAKGLKQAGYNRDKRYDDKLIEAIEKYQLYLLDEQ